MKPEPMQDFYCNIDDSGDREKQSMARLRRVPPGELEDLWLRVLRKRHQELGSAIPDLNKANCNELT